MDIFASLFNTPPDIADTLRENHKSTEVKKSTCEVQGDVEGGEQDIIAAIFFV